MGGERVKKGRHWMKLGIWGIRIGYSFRNLGEEEDEDDDGKSIGSES